jgi:mannose-1-phosphate guanylyltransferase/phosphomannomutase
MKALLLAAGEGTRMRPLTATRPKPMLPVGGRPILEHLVAQLRRYGITNIAINLHYRPEVVTDYFGDGRDFGVHITYSLEEYLLGSAGAAKALEWYLRDEPFLVLYGDVLSDIDLGDMISQHVSSGAVTTLAVHRVPDPWRCGIVRLDRDGWVERFVEKPARGSNVGNLANSGIYVVDPSVLHHIPASHPFDFGHDVFPALVAKGTPLRGYNSGAYVLDIGSPERYERAALDIRSGRFASSLFTVC